MLWFEALLLIAIFIMKIFEYGEKKEMKLAIWNNMLEGIQLY